MRKEESGERRRPTSNETKHVPEQAALDRPADRTQPGESSDPVGNDLLNCDLLARYLAGECSSDEAEEIRRWMAQAPEREDEVELLASAWELAAGLPSARGVAEMWARIAPEIKGEGSQPSSENYRAAALPLPQSLSHSAASVPVPVMSRVPRKWGGPLTIAAAAAVAVAVVTGGLVIGGRSRADRRGAAGEPSIGVGVQEFHTRRGQQGVVTLVDGTRVFLGPDSRLRVQIAGPAPRRVTLQGEAVFKVAHDPARPFLARAGVTVTEDLGTAFGIRAYAGEPVRVVVREGSVAVRDTVTERAAVLAARDLARVMPDGDLKVERNIDPELYLSWTTGRLVFRRTPLTEVIAQLERWFDIRVVVEDPSLLTATVNGAFDDSLDDLLGTLADALGTKVERRDRVVYLRGARR